MYNIPPHTHHESLNQVLTVFTKPNLSLIHNTYIVYS